MKKKIAILPFVFLCAIALSGARYEASIGNGTLRHLTFHEGTMQRLELTEVLSLTQRFPQIDSQLVQPSIRTTHYSFTESVEEVYPDGSALIGATLDSFTTAIHIGGEDFFHFNSAEPWDIQHNFHDLKVLPRAQFLGQTLKFVMGTDGLVRRFNNLETFHTLALGKGFDYDLVHALLSLSDTLRLAQLFEVGSGALAAQSKSTTLIGTVTEIPVQREIMSRAVTPDSILIRTTYIHPQEKLDYLEGIAMPLTILQFNGSGTGRLILKGNSLVRSFFKDSTSLMFKIDVDTVHERIVRSLTSAVYPIKTLRGGSVQLKEIKEHRAVQPDPAKDSSVRVIDPFDKSH